MSPTTAAEWEETLHETVSRYESRKQLHDYDIVIGPIADDTVGFQIRRFEDGVISLRQFLEEIKFNHITIQYFFATDKAVATLERL